MVNYQNQKVSSQSDKGLDRYEYLGRDTVSAYKLKSTPTWKNQQSPEWDAHSFRASSEKYMTQKIF